MQSLITEKEYEDFVKGIYPGNKIHFVSDIVVKGFVEVECGEEGIIKEVTKDKVVVEVGLLKRKITFTRNGRKDFPRNLIGEWGYYN